MAENAGSVLRPARPAERSALPPAAGRQALGRRIASALVMVPVALAAVWYGPPATIVMAAFAAGLMAWEWGRLIGRPGGTLDPALMVGTATAAVLAAGFASVAAGLAIAVAGVVALVSVGNRQRLGWTALGLAWIILPSIGFNWLRAEPFGLRIVLWLLALVWSIDIAAYAVGRTIGGPKLAPRISPNKTWSGLLGGITAAMLVGLATGWFYAAGSPWRMMVLSGGLAVVEQIGDIAESLVKRRFGAKDSGSLIPGHGGLLDRLDGMLAVVAAVTLLTLFADGTIVTWR
jgi:phosphatidate cytidylyltransferase